jgi:hypothetical protein
MTKEEFIKFIKELGFMQTWTTKPNHYSLYTDSTSQKYSPAYVDQLQISINDEIGLVQLSLSQMDSHMMSGNNFGNFSLKTFGDKDDFQLELFLSFILGSFDEKPKHIIQWIRDKKIQNILQ